MDYLKTIRRFYPNAHSSAETVDRLLDLLSSELGLQPNRIMSADSICSDDLNAIEYPQRAYEMLGPFKMGGLNGFPFTGLTGMGAFAHHVPEDGAVFVFYGPHIGITQAGVAGEVLRPGQTQPSACCGAARAALAKLLSDEIPAGRLTELDYQQNTIEQILLAGKDRIVAAPEPLLAVADVMFEAIDRRIALLAEKTSYPCRHLILMGGVLINADHGFGSFASIRRLDCIELATGKRLSLADRLFA